MLFVLVKKTYVDLSLWNFKPLILLVNCTTLLVDCSYILVWCFEFGFFVGL